MPRLTTCSSSLISARHKCFYPHPSPNRTPYTVATTRSKKRRGSELGLLLPRSPIILPDPRIPPSRSRDRIADSRRCSIERPLLWHEQLGKWRFFPRYTTLSSARETGHPAGCARDHSKLGYIHRMGRPRRL